MAYLVCIYLLYIMTILLLSLYFNERNDKALKYMALGFMCIVVIMESVFIFTTKNMIRQEIITDYEKGKFSYEKVEEVKYVDGIAVDTITTFNIKK